MSPFIDKAPGNKLLHKVTYAFNYLFICLTPQLDSDKSYLGQQQQQIPTPSWGKQTENLQIQINK